MLSPPIYIHPTHQGKNKLKNTTNAYLKTYKYLRNHKKFTIANASRLSKLLPGPGVLNLNESTWYSFTKTLENCIENQTVITDITKVYTPIEILYGSRDQLIISENIKMIGAIKNVNTTQVKGAGHTIRKSYAEAVVKILLR